MLSLSVMFAGKPREVHFSDVISSFNECIGDDAPIQNRP